MFWLGERDRIVGVLPFFHSFGFTVTIWLPLVTGCGAAYHPNPTDAKAIGELIAKYKGTFLLSTPTFCSGYARKCTKEQFATLRFVLVGAEKLRESIAKQFRRGVRSGVAGRLWVHGDVAGGGGERAELRSWARYAVGE